MKGGVVVALGVALMVCGGCTSRITGGEARRETFGVAREQVKTGETSQSQQQVLLVRVTADAVEIRSDRALIATSQPSFRLASSEPREIVVSTQPTVVGYGNLPRVTSARPGRVGSAGFEQAKPLGVFYIGALVLGVAAVVAAVKFQQWTLGACLGVSAAAAAVAPTLIENWGRIVSGMIVTALAGGAVFVAGKLVQSHWLRARALPGVAKLAREGRGDEAMAAARAVDPKLDAAFAASGGGGGHV